MRKPNISKNQLAIIFSESDTDNAWSESWGAMQVGNAGTILQTIHQVTNRDGGVNLAVSLLWLPNVKVTTDEHGNNVLT